MKSFETKEFWDWLYSFGQTPLSEEVFNQSKTDFVYKKEKKQSEYEGELFDWNFETLLIELPINGDYSLCLLLRLDGKSEFEENLYLKQSQEFHPLGWYDCHSHEVVLRFEEFSILIHYLENNLNDPIQFHIYFLLLARYVALINEKDATQLMNDAVHSYSNLLQIKQEANFELSKSEPYGTKIPGTDWVMKLKKIKTDNIPLHFTINEGMSWEKQQNNIYHLSGFAAHSMRSKCFDDGLKTPIDIYSVQSDACDYSFPYELWDNLMKSCSQ